jgi:hypothetical protein
MPSTNNDVRPNRDESNYAFIVTIDGDQMEVHEVTRYKISQNPPVASRSRRVITIFNNLFIRQLESNSLYSILHINDAKSTRNDK